MDWSTIGKNIDKLRKDKCLTKVELSELIGINKDRSIIHISGTPMNVSTFLKYLDVLDCTVYDLIKDPDENTQPKPRNLKATDGLWWHYPFNLAADVYDADPENTFDITQINVLGLVTALEHLDERHRSIILMRYRNGLSLAEIAKEYGVTQSRIGQIVQVGVKKLASSKSKKYWLMVPAREVIDLRSENHRLVRQLNIEKMRVQLGKKEDKTKFDVRVIDLDISNRAKNAMIRHGIFTLNDARDFSYDELLTWPGVGPFTRKEICDELWKYGIDIYAQEEEEE